MLGSFGVSTKTYLEEPGNVVMVTGPIVIQSRSGELTARIVDALESIATVSGEMVAVGAPEWRVRYRPRSEGRMCYRLFLGRGGEMPAAPSAASFPARQGPAPAQLAVFRAAAREQPPRWQSVARATARACL